MTRDKRRRKAQTTLILHNYVLAAMDARAAADRLKRSVWLNQLLALRLLDGVPAEERAR